MRFTMSAIAVAVVLALVLPFGAEAGGYGAVKATIYEGAEYDGNPGPGFLSRTYANGDEVGFAILNATGGDTMNVLVKIKDGLPDTEFAVTVVPGNWAAETKTLTTDKNGKGSLSFDLDIPQLYIDEGVAHMKVILTSADGDIYVTDTRDPPFVNPPDAYPGSTTHAVNLK
ncbi:MAG: hypothetical protein L6Q95_07005 [Planctomycetes bacterium]|nr:hypothetical protein [Planctomycetota bacterium]